MDRLRSEHPDWFPAATSAPVAQPIQQPVAPAAPDPIEIDWSDPKGVEKAIQRGIERGAQTGFQQAMSVMHPLAAQYMEQSMQLPADLPADLRSEIVGRFKQIPPDQLPGVIQSGLHKVLANSAIGEAVVSGKYKPGQTPARVPSAEPVGGAPRLASSNEARTYLKQFESAFGPMTEAEQRSFMRDFDAN